MDSKALLSGISCLDCKGFKQLLDSQSLVDCTLACDGGKISAHKLVLSACSSYLAKILIDHPVEHPIIILPELNIEDVKTLVHYMYTGELLKSDTINSISLLRTAAILSINSLNDLLLATAASPTSTSPNNFHIGTHHHQQQQQQQQFNSITLGAANNITNQQANNSICPPPALHSMPPDRGISLVEQLSPLLAAISQHQQQQMKLNQQQQPFGAAQTTGADCAFQTGFNTQQSQNEQGRILSNSSSGLLDNCNGGGNSNLSSILNAAAAAAAAAASVNGRSLGPADTVAQLYNSLTSASGGRFVTGAGSPPPLVSGNIHTSSPPSSTSSSPLNTTGNHNNSNNKSNYTHSSLLSEPFSYSSAITGVMPASMTHNTNGHTQNNSSTASSSAGASEFQFKCPVCQNHFQTICSFEYHMQRAHSVTSFGCEICHKPFASLRYVLTDHMRRCHGWKGASPNTNGSSTKASNNSSNNNNNNNNSDQEQQKPLQC